MSWDAHTSEGIAYLERPGNGPVLVLLHGIGSNAASFTPLLAHLPATARAADPGLAAGAGLRGGPGRVS